MAYGPLSKLFHRLALNSDLRCEIMFDLERSIYRDKTQRTDNHVFVCGLARAGTTITMRSLYESGGFSSLTYRDMPFPLMPNLWHQLSSASRRHMELTERAHKDGIHIDYDSPEALEEVFWRVFAGKLYRGRESLSRHRPDDEVIDRFADYIDLINLRAGKQRYLSKNNNNILRSEVLANSFPASAILIPFRNPLTQSASLLRQHKHFEETHREDPFSRRYVDWLVRHEFGSNHKPFRFGTEDAERLDSDSSSLKYWLRQWIVVYENLMLLHRSGENVYFVCYEDLCSPKIGHLVWERLSVALNIPPGRPAFLHSDTKAGYDVPDSLTDMAMELYEQLRQLTAEKLGYLR